MEVMVRSARSLSAAILVVVAFVLVDTAAAEVLVNERAATVEAMTGPQPDGTAGLSPADGLVLVAREPVPPPPPSIDPIAAADLAPLGSYDMERLLYRRLRAADDHRVIVDELGPAFRGSRASRLARALDLLSERRAWFAKGDLTRRVHVYVQAIGGDAGAKDRSALRSVLLRAGGVWLKAFAPGEPWADDQWQTIPAAVAGLARRPGEASGERVHLVFGPGDQDREWRLAGGSGNCALLLNGPGSYEVGADAQAFVARYRQVFGAAGTPAPTTCRGPSEVDDDIARALQAAVAFEATGVELSPAPAPPPLPVGAPARIDLGLGPDPLGLAAAFGLSSEQMWAYGGFRVLVAGAGTSAEAPVEGDDTARLLLTPTAPGPLQATLTVQGASLLALLGPDADLLATLQRIGGDPTLLERVAADPAGWSLAVPVRPAGTPVGSPVAQVIAVS